MTDLPTTLDGMELVRLAPVKGDLVAGEVVPIEQGKRIFGVRIDERHVVRMSLEVAVEAKGGAIWQRPPTNEEIVRGIRAAAIAAGLMKGDPEQGDAGSAADQQQEHWLNEWEKDR